MRARHPDLFSDTRVETASRLPKSVFEYHLETLTSRKQEYEFEHFCRKLAEKEICPNLRIQTGPTGGGDSKVDTETYPVAKEISERWWIGSSTAANERWAFAFSAKKDWKRKATSDVEKIISTKRNYRKIYFLTNQFVRDRARADHEDLLTAEARIQVVILDRAWITEKVYENGHLETAIATLGLEDVISDKVKRLGPRDTARLAELEELDQQVADPSRYQHSRYHLVDDCLRGAILARSLERFRAEVEARFTQAGTFAAKENHHHQRLRVAYHRAWTAYWWYEDYIMFSQFYDETERLVIESKEVREVELLMNLWMILYPQVLANRIESKDGKIEDRETTLREILRTLADDMTRPNNALDARSKLILIDITKEMREPVNDNIENYWDQLEQVIDQTDGLISFPMERLFGLVAEIADLIDSAAFDSLYDRMVNIIATRRSEGEAGKAYARRGIQKLGQEQPYEAIKWLGKAEPLLMKDEFTSELILCLISASCAYERSGLLWAAYNKIMAAVERAITLFYNDGTMPRIGLLAADRLVWIELQIGRVPRIFGAILVSRFIASHTRLSDRQTEIRQEELLLQDVTLGIHFLNIPLECLHTVTELPDTLGHLYLSYSRAALLFALGYDQALRDDGFFSADEPRDSIQDTFKQWRNSSAADDLPAYPILSISDNSIFSSRIFGSQLVIQTDNEPVTHAVSESILGFSESLLSTSYETEVVPFRDKTVIRCVVSDDVVGIPVLDLPTSRRSKVSIRCPRKMVFQTANDQESYRMWVSETALSLISRMFIIRNRNEWFERIAHGEGALPRSLIPGNVLTVSERVFGEERLLRLRSWLVDGRTHYEVKRTASWNKAPRNANRESDQRSGDGPQTYVHMDRQRIKHSDRRVFSPIDIPLWDRATWRGALFTQQYGRPPVLALLFEDRDAGLRIFEGWIDRIGKEDRNEWLRIAIIRGVSRANPAEYSVRVGANWSSSQLGESTIGKHSDVGAQVCGLARPCRRAPRVAGG